MGKRCLALGLLLSFVACSSMSPGPAENSRVVTEAGNAPLKKKILLLKFLNRSPYTNPELIEQAYSDIRSVARRTPDVVLIEETALEGNPSVTFDGLTYDLKTIYDRSRALGISGVILGAIEDLQVEKEGEESGLFRTSQYQVTAQVRFQLMDTSSEREVAGQLSTGKVSESHTFLFGRREVDTTELTKGTEAVSKALEQPLANFSSSIRRLGWVGRVAKIELHRYYINAGEETGLTKGQLLKVFADSMPVNDPKTGLLIGLAPGRFKGMLRVIDFMGKDGAVATLHSGADIREQDRVETFSPR